MFEWIVFVICIIPAAASDVKYRTVSLESCVVALLGGCAVFVIWCMTSNIQDILVAGMIGGSAAVATIFTRRRMGSGDWWFCVGIILVSCTIHPLALICTLALGLGALLLFHVVICVRRAGMPFPQRLYQFKKRAGDRFCVDCITGEMLKPDTEDVVVRPGLPMVTFLVVSCVICSVWFLL